MYIVYSFSLIVVSMSLEKESCSHWQYFSSCCHGTILCAVWGMIVCIIISLCYSLPLIERVSNYVSSGIDWKESKVSIHRHEIPILCWMNTEWMCTFFRVLFRFFITIVNGRCSIGGNLVTRPFFPFLWWILTSSDATGSANAYWLWAIPWV